MKGVQGRYREVRLKRSVILFFLIRQQGDYDGAHAYILNVRIIIFLIEALCNDQIFKFLKLL